MRPTLPLLLAALLTLAGCDDSPTDPDQTLTLTGSLTRGTKIDHPLPMPHGGNVTIRLEDVTPQILDVTNFNPNNLVLLVGLGRPTVLGCNPQSTTAMVEQTVSSYGLRAGDYCISVFDGGSLPEDSLVTYTILTEITD
jgi:hypothetical protein